MELSTLKKPDLVVALDIGSTYSGYAWQWRGNFDRNRGNIEFNDQWGTAAPRLRKTTTCLLLDENKEVNSFGQLAEKRYCQECDSNNAEASGKKWHFFKKFKLVLYHQSGENLEQLRVDDHQGEHLPLIEVMSKFIGALKQHFLDKLQRMGHDVNLNKTLWVVTVPAIWSDAAKSFMALAAERSGIHRKNLLIALEPEAAAIHCIHLPNEERIAMGSLGEKGDKFLTVDLGGGTTDILALHVRDDGTLEEMDMGKGGLVGGQDVNDAFFQSFHDAFHGNVWTKVAKESHAVDLLEMENDFESQKVSIGLENTTEENLMLRMPEFFSTLLEKGEIRLDETEESKNRFKIARRSFYFSSGFIREKLFEVTVRRILEVVNEIMKREQTQAIDKVVLVGGFTESPIVVGKIKDFLLHNFPNKSTYVPTSPLSAVMSGAVLFGHDPFIFFSRICRATYGIETNSHFDPKVHHQDKKWTHEETRKDWCKDIFDIHVEKGTSVRLGQEQPSKIYYPLFESQTVMHVPIHMSQQQYIQRPAYVTDDHCKKIGEIKVDMSDTKGGRNRKVIVTMIYGGTELDVIAKEETSGQEHKATLRFDTL